MAVSAALQAHLDTGTTTLCRCWRIRRRDGRTLGFTDHDRDLGFDGTTFKADTGLTAQALEQSTGLSVDNSEALGALSAAAVTEEDLAAGRFDGAEVESWLVNWADPATRHPVFRGHLGEVRAGGGVFRAELRGLTEALNQPQGRAFQPLCSAHLGDGACKVALGDPAHSVTLTLTEVRRPQELRVTDPVAHSEGWFTRGEMVVLSGAAKDLSVQIKEDQLNGTGRTLHLWEDLRAPLVPGDQLRLTAGCDKRAATCRGKFGNFLNFRGFPDIPGDDWLMAVPKRAGRNNGGSRVR
ncbi:DUF2163 domain-containing protein [Fluviibacterium sp. DFM31]|uniref:DUF2163 domain-containing protein n=1 Tax=Meridianimarinicoccus marinus TaxID=3231483 RepID=A0ABV3L2U2_9RHOB